MPALRAFKRRWNLGSDDFVVPGIIEVVVRGTWLAALLVVYFINQDDLDCPSASKTHMFYLGTMVVLLVHIVLSAATTALSTRGTIKHTAPRRHVATTLYLRLACLVPELGWSLYGAYLTFRALDGCQNALIRAGRGVVVVEWIILATIAVAVVFMFDPLGRRHMRQRSTKDYENIWRKRCRVLCCCVSGDENRKGAFDEIADLLTKFFKGKDVVLSDIAAGLVLLNVQQRFTPQVHLPPSHDATDTDTPEHQQLLPPNGVGDKAEPRTTNETAPQDQDITDNTAHSNNDSPPITLNFSKTNNNLNKPEFLERSSHESSSTSSSTSSLSSVDLGPIQAEIYKNRSPSSCPREWMTLENAEYYSKYAVGIYAKYNYTMCKNCGQRLPLCRKYRCCCRHKTYTDGRVEGDNSCECQTAALLHYTQINPDDIIFANFENQIYETPYFIALDDARKSIIIAIRGTKTFQDAVTDLTAFGENFEAAGVPPGNVHGGIMKVALNIKEQLDKINFQAQIPQGYKVIVTGHSLGAGAAVILSMLLRSQYPELKCFAYSPPGGLVSLALQMHTEQFVCSVVLGNDLVPRLSLVSMEKFKYNLLKALKRCKVPKYKVLARGLLAMCCGWGDSPGEDMLVSTLPYRYDSRRSPSNNSKTSIATTRLFDIGQSGHISTDGRQTSQHSAVSRESDGALEADGTELTSRPSAMSLAETNTDSEAESTDSNLEHIRRRKEAHLKEGKARPSTYHQFATSHTKWKKAVGGNARSGLMVMDPLYLPGHILHIIEEVSHRPMAKPTYKSEWASAQDFTEIRVCPNMLHHHHGYILRDVLQQMVARGNYTSSTGTSTVIATEPRASHHDHVVQVEMLESTT